MSAFDRIEEWFRTRIELEHDVKLAEHRLLPDPMPDRISALTSDLVEMCEPPTQQAFYAVLNESRAGSFVVNAASRAISIMYYAYARGWFDELEAFVHNEKLPTSDLSLFGVPNRPPENEKPLVVPRGQADNLTILAGLLDRMAVVIAGKPDDLTEPLNAIRMTSVILRKLASASGGKEIVE